MEQVKRAGRFPRIFFIQRLNAGDSLLDERVVLRRTRFRRIGQIGEQSKMQMRVLAAQKVQFQLFEKRLDFGGVGQQRWDNHQGHTVDGNAVLKIHFRQDPRTQG